MSQNDEAEISPRFSELRLFNFKSYGEEASVSWKQISAIVGLNGSGKSTILDAIEYVFCFPRYDKISVKSFKQDICNHDQATKKCTRTWVQVTLKLNGTENIFRRSALYDKLIHQYSINGEPISMKDYKSCLLEHNVNSQANNFLVQQNAIENIALCGEKDRCLQFEHLSDSISLKHQYNDLKKKLEKANASMSQSKKDLDYLDAQKKKLAKLCGQSQKYEKLQKKHARAELKYHFVKFYQIDKSIENLLEEREDLIEKINEWEKKEEPARNKVKETKIKLTLAEESLKGTEEESSLKKKYIAECELDLYKCNQELSCIERDITKIKQKLIEEEKVHEKRKDIISELQDEYREVEDMKKAYESSQSQTISIELQDEQYCKYLQLKDEAMRKIASDIPQLKSLEMELDSLRNEIKYIEVKRESLMGDVKKQRSKCELTSDKESKVRNNMDAIRLDLEQIDEAIKKFEGKKIDFEKTIMELNSEIRVLNQEIYESNFSIGEEKKAQKKRQVLESLKSHFPGVIDRLKNLICVITPDLEIAITKIIGNKADNIVVDSESTAQTCIRFLKEQYAGDRYSVIETFLPMNLVKPKSLNEIQRVLKAEPEATLALNEIGVQLPELKGLLHHHIGNVIICETDEEASRLSCQYKINCVSYNGSYYRKDGLFSGGLANLKEKSRQWKMDDKYKMKETRDKLIAELEDLEKKLQKVRERLDDCSTKRNSQNTKITKYLEPSLQELLEMKNDDHQKLSELEQKLNSFDTDFQLQRKQKLLKDKLAEVEELKMRRNEIEDEIFEEFCSDLNINNIRQYEQGGFKEQQERKERVKEYEDQLDRIRSQIQFEKQRDTKYSVEKSQKDLKKLKNKCVLLKQKISELQELITREKNDEVFVILEESKNEYTTLAKQLKIDISELKGIQKKLSEWGSNVRSIEAHIANLRTDKHTLLTNCKINSIEIPLNGGVTVEDVLLRLAASESSTDSENSTQQSDDSLIKEDQIEIDYSKLDDETKALEEDGMNNRLQQLREDVTECQKELQEIRFDPEAKNNLKTIELKRGECQNKLNEKIKVCNIIKKDFDEVKAQRYRKFNEFFEVVSKNISQIFKSLYNDDSAQAHIHLKNPEEPYLDGIQYTCLIPKKRCVPMEGLSGGEKTISSLAMLLALYSVKPAPFLVFDEIDAALDNIGIKRIRKWFLHSKLTTQIIIVSHHELLSNCADALIGINLSPETNSSYVIHFDLKKYQEKTTEATSLIFNEETRCILLEEKLV